MSGEKNKLENNTENLQKANLWWDNLQKTLDEADCGIDLTQPEDTARLNIIEYIKNGPDDYVFNNTFALDPEEKPIDIITITDDDILSRQKTDSVSDDVKLKMYNAAKNGTLFVTSIGSSKVEHKQRQIFADESGLPRVGNDIDSIGEEESEAIGFLDKPTREKPQKPSDAVYEKAKKGDKGAEGEVNSYNRKLKKYNDDLALWNRAQEIKENNPDLYNKAYNLAVTAQQYFGDFWTPNFAESFVEYNRRLVVMHKNSVLNKMPEDLRNAHIYLDEVKDKIEANRIKLKESLDGKLKGELSFKSRKILAELFVYREEMMRVQTAIENGNVQNLEKMSDEIFNRKLDDLRKTAKYQVGFSTLDAEAVDGMLMTPGEKFYTKLDKIIQKTNDNSAAPSEERISLTQEEALSMLQEVLNEGGFDIDVNSKEDLARLYISEIDKNNLCTMRYAADPEQKPIDPETITKEETLKRQGNILDEETLDRIIKAAKEGRLFAEGHMHQKPPVGAKQIILNDDRKFSISKRPEELTGVEAEVFEMIEKPKEVTAPAPGGFDKFLAYFGNKKATNKIRIYDSAVRSYNQKMEKWNRVQQMDKKARDRARNYSYTVSGFFNAVHENGFEYKDSLTELHRDAEIEKLDPIANKKEKEMETRYEELREEIVKISKNFISLADNRFVQSDELINDTNAFMFATALAVRKEMHRIDEIRENKNFDNFEPKSFDEITEDAMKLYNSEAFKEYAGNTTNATLITTYESIKSEKYTYIAILDQPLAEVMPEVDPVAEAIQNIDNRKEKVENNPQNANEVKNEAKIRAKLNEYQKAFGKCLLHLKNCEQKEPTVNIKSDKADPDIAKTLATMFTISKEMKNLGNRKEDEWKSLKDLENSSKEFYSSNSFEEMSKFITVEEAIKVVNNENGSPADIINRVEKLFDDADKKVKLESTINKQPEKSVQPLGM